MEKEILYHRISSKIGGVKGERRRKEKNGKRPWRSKDRASLVACNLRPLKTRWETARLLWLNGTGDGMRRTGRNVEGSREDGRETYALLLGEVLASRPRHATWRPRGGVVPVRVVRSKSRFEGAPCSRIGWRFLLGGARWSLRFYERATSISLPRRFYELTQQVALW